MGCPFYNNEPFLQFIKRVLDEKDLYIYKTLGSRRGFLWRKI